MINIMLDMFKNKTGYDCITLDDLVSLAQNVLPNGENISSDEVYNVLLKLKLLRPYTLTLAENAVDYGYAFSHLKKYKTPYGEYTSDIIYFTPEGVERIIEEMRIDEWE